jgi:hypothetical protein
MSEVIVKSCGPVACRAVGDLQLRLCSVPRFTSQASSLNPSSRGDSLPTGSNLSPLKAPRQQPDGSRRRRTASDASRFAAEAALQAAANGTNGIIAASIAASQQQQPGNRPASKSLAAGAAADGSRVSPFAAAQQQVRKQPSGAGMNGGIGGRQESRAWRQLQRASMQQELHDRQQQMQVGGSHGHI